MRALSGPLSGGDRRRIRSAWRQIEQVGQPEMLRVALLASYTADPLVPYLGLALAEAGLPAAFQVGPYNQIAQECLDGQGQTAAFAPDVLVILPRFEELPDALQPGADWAADLAAVTETAIRAADSWPATLVAVLPAIPDGDPAGVGGDSSPDGSFATAALARERMRRLLARQPQAYAVDLEVVLRSVGTARAYHPALFQHAKIPYTEEVFQQLGGRIARMVRLCFGDTCRAAAVDVRSFTPAPEDVDALGVLLRLLRTADVPAYVLGDQAATAVWRAVASADAAVPALAADWFFDARPATEQVGQLAARAALDPGQVALFTRAAEALVVTAGEARPGLRLAPQPETWAAGLAAAGVFDRLVPPASGRDAPAGDPAPGGPPGGGGDLTLDSFVAGLGVQVEFQAAAEAHLGQVSEMLHRTKDFTLGTPFSPADAAASMSDASRGLLVGTVRDRFGDFGLSVTAALRFDGTDCTVHALLVSCPVMGKGVEKEVIRQILADARGHGCARVVLPYQDTGRNRAAIDFLEAPATRQLAEGGDQAAPLQLVAVPSPARDDASSAKELT